MQTKSYERSNEGIELQIPGSVVQAIRLPENRMKQELMKELALTLYAQEIVSFGKARELAGLGKFEFGILLGQRGICRHYGADELEDDLAYACDQQHFAHSETHSQQNARNAGRSPQTANAPTPGDCASEGRGKDRNPL